MEHKGTKRLETKRLILRQYRVDDAEDMFNHWASDPEVTKFLTWPAYTEVEMANERIADWISNYPDPAFYNWAIELKSEGFIIGSISVVRMNETVESADIGYCMGKAWWGHGIMAEALQAVVDYLFAEVGMNRIAATHDKNNPNSGRVMDKVGMQVEGILRASGMNQLGICDMVWHSILRSEWEKQRKGQRKQQPSGTCNIF